MPLTKWSPEQKVKACEEILAQVAKGRSLSDVCDNGDYWIPPRKTFEQWCSKDADLDAEYMRAREARADAIFEECLVIADSQEGDLITVDGKEMPNHDLVQRARLRIDTRKWMIGKMQPKKYGEKVALTDGEGGPLQVIIKRHADG